MKGQRVRSELEGARHSPGGHPFWSCLHQQAKDIQSVSLRERGQSRNSIIGFHISMIIETNNGVKCYFDKH
jgi:hypothetical protein